MDFKDVLAQEILAKKKKLEDAKAVSGKYVRRAEVEQIYNENNGTEVGEDEQTEEVPCDNEEDSPKKRKLDTTEDTATDPLVEENLPSDVNESIERRLKSRGQPIRLFGETDKQRAERLKVLETRDFLEDDKIGQKNEYQKAVSEIQKRKTEEEESAPKETAEVSSAMEVEEVTLTLLKEDRDKTRNLISLFFKRLVKEWGAHLEGQDEAEKKSSQGRMSLVLFKQSKESLSSFFKQLKKDQLAKDILENITRICNHMQNREYVKANDVYLKLAIGNAPWPIGVTNVGIHERSARERISSSQIAHVLNDEATRKWLQAIKRLITFCQTKYPPALRSQMMG